MGEIAALAIITAKLVEAEALLKVYDENYTLAFQRVQTLEKELAEMTLRAREAESEIAFMQRDEP